jgi:drug/metabolite transporter (DMT)-like permease
VFCGTYLAYILSVKAQKMLKPTNIAMYNYVQPIVATIVGVILGIATFGYTTALPMILIFIGVWLVNRKQN